MESFTTLFDAILAAERSLKSEVTITELKGNVVVFSSKMARHEKYLCIISDGYTRYMEDGFMKMSKDAAYKL